MTRVALISGSLRAGSVNTAVLETVAALAPPGVHAAAWEGLAALPAFNPDLDHPPLPRPVAGLREALGAAEALLLCTPEYAGALPGAFKNALDWTVGGGEMDGKPVAWINASSVAAPTGGADAHASLRRVLGYVGARVIEGACVRLPVPRDAIGPDGLIDDPGLRERLAAALGALVEGVQRPG